MGDIVLSSPTSSNNGEKIHLQQNVLSSQMLTVLLKEELTNSGKHDPVPGVVYRIDPFLSPLYKYGPRFSVWGPRQKFLRNGHELYCRVLYAVLLNHPFFHALTRWCVMEPRGQGNGYLTRTLQMSHSKYLFQPWPQVRGYLYIMCITNMCHSV